MDTLKAVTLVQAAIKSGNVPAETFFAQANEWCRHPSREPLDVHFEVRDFLAHKQGEDTGYQVPSGVVQLAQIVLASPDPSRFFTNRREG